MSWQLASFTILAIALGAGFAWYERSGSDARLVALVATLAALAALGRIAFAAIPNVKPTTDIVLISGYALGGPPGFAVGALAGLTSNFFFGQGPWTPWQMAAWGATGIVGAVLAPLTGRRIGRWPLAIVCGAAGFAFAAIQDLGDWVTYSDHSAAQLAIYVGKGIGFDFLHAAGCVAFALLLGPALMQAIQRFARRLHVDWGPVAPAGDTGGGRPAAGIRLLALAAAALAVAWPASEKVARASATPDGYLLSVQNADGGFGASPRAASSPAYAGWAALGLAATGHNPLDVRRGGATLLGYVASNLAGAEDPGSLERTILVARAAGVPATSFGGQDLVARLEHDIRADGSVQNQVNLTSFAVLALRAAGVSPPGRMLVWLSRQQDRDGGFNFATAGGTSDVDDTGSALQALAGARGRAPGASRRAVAFLRRQQARDGGFPQEPGGETNAQSTAWAVQGLIAAGTDPASVHRAGGPSPLSYLGSLIAADGHVRYSRSSDQTEVWVTGQALMALAGKSLPLAPVGRVTPPAHRRRSRATGARAAASRPTATAPVRHSVQKAKRANHVGRRSPVHVGKMPSDHVLAAGAAALAALAYAPVGLV